MSLSRRQLFKVSAGVVAAAIADNALPLMGGETKDHLNTTLLKTFSSVPVRTARKWTNALVPKLGGGFNHIVQSETYDRTIEGRVAAHHVNWIITDVKTGQSTQFSAYRHRA